MVGYYIFPCCTKLFFGGYIPCMKLLKNLWLIWSRTVDHRIGKTDEDEPDIPILTLRQAQISLFFRTFIILVNLITCFFIVGNIIHKW